MDDRALTDPYYELIAVDDVEDAGQEEPAANPDLGLVEAKKESEEDWQWDEKWGWNEWEWEWDDSQTTVKAEPVDVGDGSASGSKGWSDDKSWSSWDKSWNSSRYSNDDHHWHSNQQSWNNQWKPAKQEFLDQSSGGVYRFSFTVGSANDTLICFYHILFCPLILSK